jgi:hypothetical protein
MAPPAPRKERVYIRFNWNEPGVVSTLNPVVRVLFPPSGTKLFQSNNPVHGI